MSSTTHRNRPRSSLPLAALVAVASAVVALALAGGHVAQGHSEQRSQAAKPSGQSEQRLALHDNMRRLWEDHITWTRLFIVSATDDLPDTAATTQRLLRNQDDLGDAIKPFYGRAAGERLTGLLREHITIAAELVGAAKTGDQAAVGRHNAAWHRNANRIAGFLSKANPRHWPRREMRSMMRDHLDLTLTEAVAHLERDHRADIRAYDRIHRQILTMADMLSDGIAAQFPNRFR
jgi:septal ring factor EnvC (AmiA/AmiB activator)